MLECVDILLYLTGSGGGDDSKLSPINTDLESLFNLSDILAAESDYAYALIAKLDRALPPPYRYHTARDLGHYIIRRVCETNDTKSYHLENENLKAFLDAML